MKTTLSILFFTFSIFCMSQTVNDAFNSWVFYKGGNPIDGYIRQSSRFCGFTLLEITNDSEQIKLENLITENDGDRDNLYIMMKEFDTISPNDDICNLKSYMPSNDTYYESLPDEAIDTLTTYRDLKELLMYFDNEKTYYKVNFKVNDYNKLFWVNAVENKDTKYLGKFDFVKKIKQKTHVTFRFVYSTDYSFDCTFQLNGSKKSLDQTVLLTNFIKEDLSIDEKVGLFCIAQIENDEELKSDLLYLNLNMKNIIDKLHFTLKENLGKFYLTQFSNIDYVKGKFYIYNFNDEEILKMNIR